MPPKKITVKTGAGTTPNILVMLSKPKPKSTSAEVTKSDVAVATDSASAAVSASAEGAKWDLSHEDPLFQKFYNSLTLSEKIAHTIAKEKLGTSYDVSRTHGFLRWQKTQK